MKRLRFCEEANGYKFYRLVDEDDYYKKFADSCEIVSYESEYVGFNEKRQKYVKKALAGLKKVFSFKKQEELE